MHFSVKNLIDISEKVNKKLDELGISNLEPNIIAVSKTFSINHIKPLLDYGHVNYGENKVQEATEKWSYLKAEYPNIKLHMIGRLQTNKVKMAVKIFDFIHSVDSLKLAKKIADEQKKINKKINIFLQINIGDESQKSGVSLTSISNLYDDCINLDLNVLGLMCIPPFGVPVKEFFSQIKKKNDELNLSSLSLGMSDDYLDALEVKSNFLRIGTKIFGKRT